MKIRLILFLSFLPIKLSNAQVPVEFKAIFEVAGQDSGALLGNYVKGVGDLNKDGYDDVAVSASGKLLTYVYYGGDIMSQQPSLTLEGGGTIASGDFNGDGWIDLAINKLYMDTVLIFLGNSEIDSIPDITLAGEYNRFGYNGFGYKLSCGDINGDSFDDLVIIGSDIIKPSNEGKGKVYLFSGGVQFDTIPITTLLGDTLKAGLGWDIDIGDMNKDNEKDIIILGYNQLSSIGSEQYFYFSVFLGDSSFNMQRNYYIDSRKISGGFKDHITCFDADGDGIDDILVNKVYIFKGRNQLDTIPTYYIPPPNNDSINFGPYPWVSGGGDYNNDGFNDILLAATRPYFGGVPGVFLYLNRLNHPGEYVAYRVFSEHGFKYPLDGMPENAGDVNGDGVDDIITSSPNEPIFKDKGFFGIYSGDTNLVTDVKNKEEELPNNFNLKQNYPNPFNPETIINYALPVNEKVVIKVYNILGREVAQLLNEVKQAGTYSVKFNASSLSSGVYFYSITAGDFRKVKKMILAK